MMVSGLIITREPLAELFAFSVNDNSYHLCMSFFFVSARFSSSVISFPFLVRTNSITSISWPVYIPFLVLKESMLRNE